MPPFRNIRWVVKNDESLDLPTSEKGDGCNTCLPTQNAQPAYAKSTCILIVFNLLLEGKRRHTDNIAEELLMFFWGEL